MLKNLVVLVTGGASGLGRATAERFVRVGSQVVICDLPTSNGQNVAAEIGKNVEFKEVDVRSRSSVQNLVEQIENKYGKLNGVVNCAGISNSYPLYNFNEKRMALSEDFKIAVQTNLFGTYNVISQTAKLLSKGEPDVNGYRGVIVNRAGIDGYRGGRSQTNVAAASRGVISMTKSIAERFRKYGIRNVTITTGLFRTPLTTYYPVDVQTDIAEKFMLAPHEFGDPDQYAHMVQTIFMSPSINATCIDMSCGFQWCTNIC